MICELKILLKKAISGLSTAVSFKWMSKNKGSYTETIGSKLDYLHDDHVTYMAITYVVIVKVTDIKY